ncbi:MAG TPA: creatininase family protein [Gaiellaceae bacterium]|nr:creatininase family protein [Gaiellaceae bacterium]
MAERDGAPAGRRDQRRGRAHEAVTLCAIRVADLNWFQLEAYLERDDRIVLPLGSTEQHAYLSLATDAILAERVSVEAAEPLGVPVLPALAYGVTPYFAAFPGSPSLGAGTYVALLRDLASSLRGQGFRRVLLVNGHGGNSFAAEALAADGVAWHDWWRGPRVWEVVRAIDSAGTHASWMENFPWTRLPGVELPVEAKPEVGRHSDDPAAVRAQLGDGSYGGPYAHSDKDMLRVWEAGVAEVRAAIERL